MASSIETDLTRKVGPFPAYVWAFILAALFLLYHFWRSRSVAAVSSASQPVPVDTSGTDLGTLDTSGDIPVATGTPAPQPVPGITTNAQWIAEAEQGLLHTGHDALHILRALQKFTSGRGTLTPEEEVIVNAAIARYGMPPQGVAPVGPLPPPKPTHKTVQVTVDRFGTLSLLAQRYYGKPALWSKIRDANVHRLPAHVGPLTKLKSGLTLTVPDATRGF